MSDNEQLRRKCFFSPEWAVDEIERLTSERDALLGKTQEWSVIHGDWSDKSQDADWLRMRYFENVARVEVLESEARWRANGAFLDKPDPATIEQEDSEPHPYHCLCDDCVTLENMDDRIELSRQFAATEQETLKCSECKGTGLGRSTLDCHMCDGVGRTATEQKK